MWQPKPWVFDACLVLQVTHALTHSLPYVPSFFTILTLWSGQNDMRLLLCPPCFLNVLQDSSGGLPAASDLSAARSSQRSGNAIPVIAASTSSSSSSSQAGASLSQQVPALSGPADGFCLPLGQLVPAGAAVGGGAAGDDSSAVAVAVGALLQALTEGHTAGEPGTCSRWG